MISIVIKVDWGSSKNNSILIVEKYRNLIPTGVRIVLILRMIDYRNRNYNRVKL